MRLKPSADCADAGELSNTGAAALATAADSATAAAAAAAAAPATFAEAPAGFLWSLAAAGGVHLANVTKAGGLSLLRGAPRGGAVASVVCFDRALEAKESAKASAAFGGCVSAVEVAPSQVSTRLPPKSTHSRVWSLSRVLILRFRGALQLTPLMLPCLDSVRHLFLFPSPAHTHTPVAQLARPGDHRGCSSGRKGEGRPGGVGRGAIPHARAARAGGRLRRFFVFPWGCAGQPPGVSERRTSQSRGRENAGPRRRRCRSHASGAAARSVAVPVAIAAHRARRLHF